MIATSSCAAGARLYKAALRAIIYIPAVTIVAAWINADTGVGPAIASGSQVYKGICALLPVAPTNNSMVIPVISTGVNLLYNSNTPAPSGVVYVTVPSLAMIQKMAIR